MAMTTTTTVSIRELKDHLSSYVRRIRAGEEVVLTSRRRPVARMMPVNDPGCSGLPALPLITWSADKPRGGNRRPRIKDVSAARAVLEDRR
jgi:prevent-host-death family protein